MHGVEKYRYFNKRSQRTKIYYFWVRKYILTIRDMVFYILVSLFQTAFLGTYSTVLCIHAVSIHVLVYLAQTPYSICSNSDNTV